MLGRFFVFDWFIMLSRFVIFDRFIILGRLFIPAGWSMLKGFKVF